jgi:hypothetical protein
VGDVREGGVAGAGVAGADVAMREGVRETMGEEGPEQRQEAGREAAREAGAVAAAGSKPAPTDVFAYVREAMGKGVKAADVWKHRPRALGEADPLDNAARAARAQAGGLCGEAARVDGGAVREEMREERRGEMRQERRASAPAGERAARIGAQISAQTGTQVGTHTGTQKSAQVSTQTNTQANTQTNTQINSQSGAPSCARAPEDMPDSLVEHLARVRAGHIDAYAQREIERKHGRLGQRPGDARPPGVDLGYNPPHLRRDRREYAIGAGECSLDGYGD